MKKNNKINENEIIKENKTKDKKEKTNKTKDKKEKTNKTMERKKKLKHKKIVRIISLIIFAILLLISIGMIGLVIYLGVLPFKYLFLIILLIGILYLPLFFLINNKKIKNCIKYTCDVFCILFMICYGIGFYYLNSTLNFMDNIKFKNYQIINYHVLVNKNSDINKIKDIKELGIVETENKDILKKLDFKYNLKEFESYNDLGEAIINKDIDAILINASYMDIVSEMLKDFNDSVKDIKTISIKIKNDLETDRINVVKEPFNVYISGIDVFGDINEVSRSDVNMIATINPKTHKILLTSIPRDYYVRLHNTTGLKDKLTHAGLYGIDKSITTIEDLLDIKIDYFVRVNFTTLINLVDAIDGIDIYSDKSFTAWTDKTCHFKKGTMHVNGKCALAFARERYTYIEGDRHRVKNQQDVIEAIMKKVMSSTTLIKKYNNILNSLSSSFQTNMPTKNIYDLVNMQLNFMPKWKLERYSLNGFDSSNETYTFKGQILYVMEPDYKTVNIAKEKIISVMGE